MDSWYIRCVDRGWNPASVLRMKETFIDKPPQPRYAVYHSALDKWLIMGEDGVMDNYQHMLMPKPAYGDEPVILMAGIIYQLGRHMKSYFSDTESQIMVEVDADQNVLWLKPHWTLEQVFLELQ